MNIINKNKGYGLQKISNNCHRIVKNIKDFENEEEAIETLIKLLKGEIKEEDLINKEG